MATPPTLARQTLAQLIEEARVAAGMTASDAAAQCGMHPTALRRWELGETCPKPKDVSFLADIYEAGPEEKKLWTTLAFKAKEKNLFESAKIPPSLRVLVAAEARASRLQTIELEAIPGLLQTPAYHQATQTAVLQMDPEAAAEYRAVRVQRQEAVFGDGANRHQRHMDFIIGPAAMFYLKAWPEVEAEQLERLRHTDAMPHVSVRIITRAHAALAGSFTLITPPKGSKVKSLASVEAADGLRYADDVDVVSDYERIFRTVRDHQSVPIKEYLK